MKKIIASILMVIFCTLSVSQVFAANVCTTISGNAHSTKSFTINTGNRWLLNEKITLTQTKGTYEYRTPFSSSKTATGYMRYKVSYRIKGTSSWKTKQWTSKNITLSLKKNTTYEVQVTPYSNVDMSFHTGRQIKSWKKVATWSVKSTKGIISCY